MSVAFGLRAGLGGVSQSHHSYFRGARFHGEDKDNTCNTKWQTSVLLVSDAITHLHLRQDDRQKPAEHFRRQTAWWWTALVLNPFTESNREATDGALCYTHSQCPTILNSSFRKDSWSAGSHGSNKPIRHTSSVCPVWNQQLQMSCTSPSPHREGLLWFVTNGRKIQAIVLKPIKTLQSSFQRYSRSLRFAGIYFCADLLRCHGSVCQVEVWTVATPYFFVFQQFFQQIWNLFSAWRSIKYWFHCIIV